jgi:hypothetical protein
MNKEGNQGSDSEQLTVLRVLHHDQQAHKIILNEPLLQGLKETHSRDLIPIVHKLQEQFLILTNYLAWCTDDDTSVRATAAEALSQALPARADLPAAYHSLDTSFEQAKSNTSTEDAAPSDAPMDVEQTAKNSQEDEL